MTRKKDELSDEALEEKLLRLKVHLAIGFLQLGALAFLAILVLAGFYGEIAATDYVTTKLQFGKEGVFFCHLIGLGTYVVFLVAGGFLVAHRLDKMGE